MENSSGEKVQEASRFPGRPVVAVDPNAASAEQQHREELEAQVRGLQQQNQQQAARIQQLERTLMILRTRLGVDPGR